jgi:hypothetical protein
VKQSALRLLKVKDIRKLLSYTAHINTAYQKTLDYEHPFDLLVLLNPSTPELNPSAQRCLTRFFTRDFAS